MNQPALPPRELPRRDPINEEKRQSASERADLREQMQVESEVAQLRARVETELPAYENLTNSEKKALLTMRECAQMPQPVRLITA
jgi:hypothetical protein